MHKLITAAVALAVLSACDSEGIDRRDTSNTQAPVTQDDGANPVVDGNESGNNNTDGGADSGTNVPNEVDTGDSNTGGSTPDTGTGTGTGTDTGTGNNDGNESTEPSSGNNNGGSATSDLGNNNGGSATSDGGNNNGGSATSDGGTGNGGVIQDDGSSQAAQVTNAGIVTPTDVSGSIIRQSSLSSIGQTDVCTTASDPNDFSNTQVGDFILHNNAWRASLAPAGYQWTQCIYTDRNGATAGWNYDWGPGASSDYFVRSYPEIIFGTKDEFRTSAAQSVTGLPVQVSEMPSFQIDYSYDGPQYGTPREVNASNNPRFPNRSMISGERNVAIESFFYEQDATGNCSAGSVSRSGTSNHTYEVMVWLDAGAERLPAGPDDYVADLTIRGSLYKVYTKGTDLRYIAFVAQNPQTSGTIVWNDFVDWARENAHTVREQFGTPTNTITNTVPIQDNWCMANIIVGTEIFWGAGNVDFYDWTITQYR